MYDPRKNNYDYWPERPTRFVYGIKCGQFIKVGVARSVSTRLHNMRLLNPHPVEVVLRRKLRGAFFCERKMHEVLKPKAIGREWFDASVEEVLAAYEIGLAWAREIHDGVLARKRHNAKLKLQERPVNSTLLEL